MTCKDYFLRLLTRREYSAYELLKKGQEKGYEKNEIDDVIQELQTKDYQSDIRLVENAIASSEGKYGKSMVKRKCREKGIAADVFDQVWDSQTETETETDELAPLKAKIARKYKIDDFQNIDQKTKAKLINYLKYRGFNPFEVLEQWRIEDDE